MAVAPAASEDSSAPLLEGGPPPPIFQGDPTPEEPPPPDFPWRELQQGAGQFSADGGANGWKHVSTSDTKGVLLHLHSRPVDDAGTLFEFYVRGHIPLPRDTYFSLNADMEYRPTWDTSSLGITELSASSIGVGAAPSIKRERTLHWEVKYPWPLGRRDYILRQQVHTMADSSGGLLLCTFGETLPVDESTRLKACPSGVTRIDTYRANCAIWEQDATVSNFAMLYFEDSKVSMPGWLTQKMASTAIPGSMVGLVAAAEKYPPARLQQTLAHYGVGARRGKSAAAAAAQAADADDEEDFYSASDEEGSPHRGNAAKTPKANVAAVPRRAGGSKAAKGSSEEQKGDDLEEVLVIKKEDRDLLFELLAEVRAKQTSGPGRFSRWCCPCRCARGHRTRHKL